MFAAYDGDGDGSLTQEDMSSYFKIVIPFLLVEHAPLFDETTDREDAQAARAQHMERTNARADALAKRTFDAVDKDLSGGVDVDEFQRWIEHRIQHGPSPANFRDSAKTFSPKKTARVTAASVAEGASAAADNAAPKIIAVAAPVHASEADPSAALAPSERALGGPQQSVTDSEMSETMENSDEEEDAFDEDAGAARATKAIARLGKQRKAQRMSMALPLTSKGVEGVLLKRSKRGQWQPRYFTCQSHYLRASFVVPAPGRIAPAQLRCACVYPCLLFCLPSLSTLLFCLPSFFPFFLLPSFRQQSTRRRKDGRCSAA